MKKPSELPINSVISLPLADATHRWIRDDDDGWKNIDIDDDWIYLEVMDEYATEYTILSIPVDIPALIKNTALTTVDALLEANPSIYLVKREDIQNYRDELEKTDFTDEAVKYG